MISESLKKNTTLTVLDLRCDKLNMKDDNNEINTSDR